MSNIDFGTAQIYVTVDSVDVHVPYDPDVTAGLKAVTPRGRWVGERKCWRFPVGEGGSADEVVGRIREALLNAAPPRWRDALATLGSLAAVTSGYEFRAGPGGIRLRVPPGHPVEYALKKVDGVRQETGKWLVPARLCGGEAVREAVRRIMKDDAARFEDAVEPFTGRCLEGELAASAPPLADGADAFVEMSFVKAVWPQMGDLPLREYVFRCAALGDGGRRVRLSHLPLEDAYARLRDRAAGLGPRTPALSPADAADRWRTARA